MMRLVVMSICFHYQNSSRVAVSINEHLIEVLVDSGSTVNILNMKVL